MYVTSFISGYFESKKCVNMQIKIAKELEEGRVGTIQKLNEKNWK